MRIYIYNITGFTRNLNSRNKVLLSKYTSFISSFTLVTLLSSQPAISPACQIEQNKTNGMLLF